MKKITLDGVELINYSTSEGIIVNDEDGLIAPSISATTIPRSGKDGAFTPTAYSRERRITLSGQIVAKTKERAVELRKTLARLAPPVRNRFNAVIAKDLVLEDWDGSKYYLEVVVNSLKLPRRDIFVEDWQLDIIAKDWRLYGDVEHSVIFSQIQGGGFSIPFSIPFSFSGGGGEPTAVYNAGQTITPFKWVVKGAATNPTLTNLSTGEFMQVNTVVGVDDELIVDTGKMTATLNRGNAMQFVSIGSVFFELEAGENLLTITTGVPSEEPVSEVFWRDAYSGV